jgi:hypothetical protein
MSTIAAPAEIRPERTGTAPTRRLLLAAMLAVVVVGTGLLAHLGCERMRDAAPLGSTDSSGRTVTGYSWSVRPTGFTVRYDDGGTTTRLLW